MVNITDVLTEREYRILIRRLGVDGHRPHTLKEVGREFRVTRERIRQIQYRAIRRLIGVGAPSQFVEGEERSWLSRQRWRQYASVLRMWWIGEGGQSF